MMLIGITMIIKSANFIDIFLSLILGSITGELLRLDERLEHLMEKGKSKISPNSPRFVKAYNSKLFYFALGQ